MFYCGVSKVFNVTMCNDQLALLPNDMAQTGRY